MRLHYRAVLLVSYFGSARSDLEKQHSFPDAGHYGGCAEARQYLLGGSGSIMGSVGGAAGGILRQGCRWRIWGIKFQRIVGALLIVVVGRSVGCIVTKSLNGTHAVAMRIRHDFLLAKFMEKNGKTQH